MRPRPPIGAQSGEGMVPDGSGSTEALHRLQAIRRRVEPSITLDSVNNSAPFLCQDILPSSSASYTSDSC